MTAPLRRTATVSNTTSTSLFLVSGTRTPVRDVRSSAMGTRCLPSWSTTNASTNRFGGATEDSRNSISRRDPLRGGNFICQTADPLSRRRRRVMLERARQWPNVSKHVDVNPRRGSGSPDKAGSLKSSATASFFSVSTTDRRGTREECGAGTRAIALLTDVFTNLARHQSGIQWVGEEQVTPSLKRFQARTSLAYRAGKRNRSKRTPRNGPLRLCVLIGGALTACPVLSASRLLCQHLLARRCVLRNASQASVQSLFFNS